MITTHIHRACSLLIVGNPHPTHVGAHLLEAAHASGLAATLCDTKTAFAAPWIEAKINWWLRGHRPSHLREFGQHVVQVCHDTRATTLIATGLAPLDRETLVEIRDMGVTLMNFLTDDPWNPAHYAPWFFKALPIYDYVFSPRRANLSDLVQAGCRHVAYLPFGYNPAVHFAEPLIGDAEYEQLACDVLFVGGADRNRVPLIDALIRAGFCVALYGGYWDHYPATRAHAHGLADPATLRKAMSGARVALCLVRRANRDGHVMRSFEIPAMGGCLLAEDTAEHRALFGADREATAYFRDQREMIMQLRWLLDQPTDRARLAQTAHACIVEGHHTYRDRLETMLAAADQYTLTL